MAGTVQLWNFFSVTIDGQLITGGSLENPVPIALTSDLKHERIVSLAQNVTGILFDNATDLSASATFKFMWIVSDQDVMLELQTDSNAGIGRMLYTIPLLGSGTTGKYGAPFILARSASYALYTINFGGGTLDNIDKITAKNLGATTAKVRIFVAV